MNTIFMNPRSVVIEIIPNDGMDSRHLPINGIFPRLSAIFGFHHYLYLDNITSTNFPQDLVFNIISFVKNIK